MIRHKSRHHGQGNISCWPLGRYILSWKQLLIISLSKAFFGVFWETKHKTRQLMNSRNISYTSRKSKTKIFHNFCKIKQCNIDGLSYITYLHAHIKKVMK